MANAWPSREVLDKVLVEVVLLARAVVEPVGVVGMAPGFPVADYHAAPEVPFIAWVGERSSSRSTRGGGPIRLP
jgi:hypothetical protein